MENILNNMRRQAAQELQSNNVQEESLEVKTVTGNFLKFLDNLAIVEIF